MASVGNGYFPISWHWSGDQNLFKKEEEREAHHHHHQSLNREGRWGTKDDFATSFFFLFFSSIFPVLHCPLGLAELQACPFPDVVSQPLPLSALSFSHFHCALQDGFGQT